ncbi:hypothetical protein [Noviherbaspirillum suwonense]|nr:hypothetical protein [Noviherbaspirillum suwonense]
MILVVIVAVVGAVYAPQLIGPLVNAAGIGGTAGTVVTGALSAAAASVVSQGVAIAIGVQDKFSWSQVGLAFVGGGVAAGIGEVATGAMAGQGTFAVVSRAMLANAVSQGIGVATGLQDQFSWIGVAAAGVGAGVGQAVSEGLGMTVDGVRTEAYAQAGWGERLAKPALTGLAAGAATAVARGGRISVTQIAADAFGQAIGSSIAEANWSSGVSDIAREDFRRSEIEAMNNDARIANALAMSGLGMSEADYWNAPARTMADQYADTYGGQVSRTSGLGHTEASIPSGVGWHDADGTAWLPETTIITKRGDGGLTGSDNDYAEWNIPGVPDNASLHMVGQSADGGLIWNTGAVSYPVVSPDFEIHTLTNTISSTIQPVYDPLTGLPTGYSTEAENAGTPSMGYGEQMGNALGFAGMLGKNFSLGVAQGTVGLVSDATKGWAMIGDLALTGGKNINRLDQFNLRPFEYDQGASQFAGGLGEIFSFNAYAKVTELGAMGLRALGPTADAAIYNYLQRSGGILGVVPESAANSSVPHGFANVEDFAQFGNNMRSGLGRAGYENAEPLLQGSAVTGRSFKTGEPFDFGRVSDFDVALADPALLIRAQELGIGLRSGGTRTGPLSARDLRVLGLRDLSSQMGQQVGREVNFMIYNNSATAAQKAPSLTLPGKR